MNLGYLLDNAAVRFRDRAAVWDGVRSLTFAQLRERSLRLGNALSSCGLAPGDRIASLQPNSLETIEVDLASGTFGYVRTLLNARGTEGEHADALRRIGAKALIYSAEFDTMAESLRRQVPTLTVVLRVDADRSPGSEYETALARAGTQPPAYEIDEACPHSIYFSSGTTGRPKAILLSQRTWLALVRNHLIDTYADAGPADVVLHAAPMSHASGALVWAHLVRGAGQRVIPRFEAEVVLDAFERDRVSTLWLAPTMLYMLLDSPTLPRRQLGSLRSVRYGGAPMPIERVEEAVRRLGPVLCSGWGQWEAPQQCTFLSQAQIAHAISSGPRTRLSSVGRPVSFGRIGVVDETGNFLPSDSEGEVVVAGDHLMVEYIDQPEETSELRIGPWQRTGDIGRIDADGFVYLTDRKKDLIVTGGSNVYPKEVEEVLLAHPDVMDAVAFGVPDPMWGERVHALVVLRSGHTIDKDELLTWCRGRLAGYKRPRSVDVVNEIPKNAYGKVLRRAIRDTYWSGVGRNI